VVDLVSEYVNFFLWVHEINYAKDKLVRK